MIKNENLYDDLFSRLSFFLQKGVKLIVDDKDANLYEVMQCFELHDGYVYMPDYVFCEEGHLREIRFDKVYNC